MIYAVTRLDYSRGIALLIGIWRRKQKCDDDWFPTRFLHAPEWIIELKGLLWLKNYWFVKKKACYQLFRKVAVKLQHK